MGIEECLLDGAENRGREEILKGAALKMKQTGLDLNLIANVTGLSI